jgi:hypothetical protein
VDTDDTVINYQGERIEGLKVTADIEKKAGVTGSVTGIVEFAIGGETYDIGYSATISEDGSNDTVELENMEEVQGILSEHEDEIRELALNDAYSQLERNASFDKKSDTYNDYIENKLTRADIEKLSDVYICSSSAHKRACHTKNRAGYRVFNISGDPIIKSDVYHLAAFFF